MSDETVTPVAPVAPVTPVTPAAKEDSVTLSRAEVDQLRRDAARATEAQARADRLANANKRSKTHFDPNNKPTPPSLEEQEAQARSEDTKAERGLMRLAVNPEFREILDADPTLRDLLTTNPLAVLPIYAADAFDADDAIGMVKEALIAKNSARKAAVTPPAPGKKDDKITPPSGGVNTQGVAPAANAEYEAARKNPNLESAIASMVSLKMKGSK